MRIPKLLTVTFCLLFLQNYLSAQDKLNIKFGKLAPEDFDLSKTSFDTSASAVIIADIGNTSFEGNRKGKGDFTLVYTRFKRIKILNRNGFELANDEFIVYSDGIDEEQLRDLKASTYNLENGKVIETKLDAKSIFSDKLDRFRSKKKFTMPAVKEGSIIEIAYTIKSDFYIHLRPWNFQGEYPVLWSEYEVHIPKFFSYILLTQGDQNFHIKTSKLMNSNYTVRVSGGTSSDDIYNLNSDDLVNRWVKKDVPALKAESFTTTIFNHVSRVEFQLNYIQFTDQGERHIYMGDWYTASEKMLKNERFGATLSDDNRWMGVELKSITTDAHDNLDKMERIYDFERDHFTCTDHDALYADKSLKTVFKSRNGNVAEINLLLVAMLRHEDIDADPMVLSTRDNGYSSDAYPLMNRFNYVICVARINDKTYYLDASQPLLGFAHLPIDCYNGMARTINKDKPFVVYFEADSLRESKQTSVMIINDEKGKPTGSFESTLGYYESYDLREKVKKKTEKGFFKDIQTKYGSDLEIENTSIDSLSKLEYPARIHYDFNIVSGMDGVIYFNPMLSEAYKENPFKAADRKYPVEMPYTFDEMYIFNMEIPQGYEVEEIPKSARVAYNENQGIFEYLIQKDATAIQMRTRIKLNKATFSPEEYNTLRDFFAYIVKKEGEQIVFKKKK